MSNSIRDDLRSRLEGTSVDEAVDILFAFLCDRGTAHYEERVTQIEHALQCAALAEAEGCDDTVVTAALFHDIGHLLIDEHESQTGISDEDPGHEAVGASLLQDYFPAKVTEPVRLHVPAKRYLCTTDESYYDQLSDASKRSFQVQGGKLSADEKAELESKPGLKTALKLRLLDDRGKQIGGNVPEIQMFAAHVGRCLRPDRP